MPGLGKTVSELTMLRRMREAATRAPTGSGTAAPLVTAMPAGSNPGGLKMVTCVPPGLPHGAPLVVVLHGCMQNAAGYDVGSGWSSLAARHGFALLYPEQQSCNNGNTCFNWFQPTDVTRDHGEVASIAEMVGQMVADHALNPARIYITGLSAGGAMTAAMLATYPELFAGGAIIAGLPYGAASSMPSAFEAMRHLRSRTAQEWGDLVRRASPFTGDRPPVQIWHGDADTTVGAQALTEATKQWADVLGIGDHPTRSETIEGATHLEWAAEGGRVLLETYLLPGVGHGVPLFSKSGDWDDSVGAPAAYMLEGRISSTRRIAASWGLLTQAARTRTAAQATRPPELFAGMIHGALRAAGLKI